MVGPAGLAAFALALLAMAATPPAVPPPAPEAEAEEARLQEAARLRSIALAEMEDGDYAQALSHLAELAELLPENVLPPVNLAICHLHLNRRDDALAEIHRARELAPDNPQVLYTLARALEGDPASPDLWSEVLDHFAQVHPGDPRPLYLRARRLAGEGAWGEAVSAFEAALRRSRDNLALMVELLTAAARGGEAEAVADALYAIEDRLNGFEGQPAEYAERIHDLLDEEDLEGVRPAALVLGNLLRPTELYQIGLAELLGGRGAGGEMFPQLDFEPPLPKRIQGGQDIEIAFADATGETGLDRVPPAPWTVPDRRTEVDRLLTGGDGGLYELELGDDGRFQARPVALEPALAGRFFAYDVDQDGVADLVSADPTSGVRLYPGREDGSFAAAVPVAGPWDEAGLTGLFPLEVDHDGDLDLLVAREGVDLYLQNNGDGAWPERAGELGLAGPAQATADLAVADFDDDGDLDLVTVHPAGPPRLYLNGRSGSFQEAGRRAGLEPWRAGHRGVQAADFDLDGRFDLVLWGEEGSQLLLNRGGRFEPMDLPEALGAGWRAGQVADFDNDGDPDLIAVLAADGRVLLGRNRRPRFSAEETGLSAPQAASLAAGDYDRDGDLDLVAREGDGGRRFWRNQGGDRNQWLRLRLVGRHENNAKNNTQGLFTRIELRSGDAYQAVIGHGGANHLGLGARRQADVIRVVWTNGVGQTWTQVGANRTLVEEQVLKGSCPFLYTWDGEGFRFVTDLMWRSPLGMLLADGSPAPHQSARDFVLVPGEALRAAGGELWLQVTEELWETAYVDRQQLLAVDYPVGLKQLEDLELVVDERVTPPPYPRQAPVHWLGRRLHPVAARDHRGRDVLAQVLHRDGRHVDDLPLGRYQGLTRGHHLDLTFEGVPEGEPLRLVLWGWTFPTDTSINFALAQDSSRELVPPRLEVLEEDGRRRTVLPAIGFPAGKRKAMVVELPGDLPRGRVTLRITTSMQIYWDAVVLAPAAPALTPRVTRLEPRAADLHYRGFSRLYRESPTGPHLFDYDDVTVEPRFRDMTGAFTRFGEVTELLAREDDRYVVMNAGDELTVRFDASRLPPLPAGWRRDYVLYTDGWVKDGDLHTTASQTVEPLPYHAMGAYPDQPEHRYPDSPAHQQYLERYQTRRVTGEPFREALAAPGFRPPARSWVLGLGPWGPQLAADRGSSEPRSELQPGAQKRPR